MTANERKKYKAKQRKLAKQKAAAEASKEISAGGGGEATNVSFLAKEEAEAQKVLYDSTPPLDEAHKLLVRLEKAQREQRDVLGKASEGNVLRTQLLAAQWALRSGKSLLAVKALVAAKRESPKDPQLQELASQLKHQAKAHPPSHPLVKKVLDAALTNL